MTCFVQSLMTSGRALDTAPPALYTLLEIRKNCPEILEKCEVSHCHCRTLSSYPFDIRSIDEDVSHHVVFFPHELHTVDLADKRYT